MHGEAADSGDDIDPDLQELFGQQSYEVDAPSRQEFHPWHQPRKHWVRVEQWAAQIEKVRTEHWGKRMLRYLCLPGPDLLDIRFLHHQVCPDCELRFLGFNAEASGSGPSQLALNTSFDEVKRLDGIDPRSLVIPDDLRTLANDRSLGWRRAVEFAPFDVINLDLCDGVFHDAPEITRPIKDAILRLFDLQQRNKEPWLLLLTTRVGADHVDPAVVELLDRLLEENISGCPEFRAAYIEHICPSGDGSTRLTVGPDESYLHVFCTALCKWLVQLNSNSPAKFELKSCASYLVEQGSPYDDLLSLVIKVTPLMGTLTDRAGIAASAGTAPPSECEQAQRIPKRAAKTVPVDQALDQDPDLKSLMIEGAADLLEEARYNRAEYIAWAKAH